MINSLSTSSRNQEFLPRQGLEHYLYVQHPKRFRFEWLDLVMTFHTKSQGWSLTRAIRNEVAIQISVFALDSLMRNVQFKLTKYMVSCCIALLLSAWKWSNWTCHWTLRCGSMVLINAPKGSIPHNLADRNWFIVGLKTSYIKMNITHNSGVKWKALY